jgi:hypothetical protein
MQSVLNLPKYGRDDGIFKVKTESSGMGKW